MGHSIPTAPTSTLPSLKSIADHTLEHITHALDNLRYIYSPDHRPAPKLCVPKRSTNCLIHDDSVPDSGYASAEEDEEDPAEDAAACMCAPAIPDANLDVDVLRSDAFERGFVIKWLTGLIARSDTWVSASPDENDADQRAEAVDSATALLCAFSGDGDADAALARSFSFPTLASREVRVELNDAPLPGDDHTSVGLQSWASAIVLAKMMCAAPGEFGFDSGRLRVLELGAGTGLLSIVAGKLLQQKDDARWTIVATDYHPDVLGNLALNVGANFPCPPVDVLVLDWEHPDYAEPLHAAFDVILAADVIYHPDHAGWIKGCVERLLRRPSGADDSGGIFWLMIPVRLTGRHEGMHGTVDEIFEGVGTGQRLVVLEKVEIVKGEDVGRADESGYRLFKIGWSATVRH